MERKIKIRLVQFFTAAVLLLGGCAGFVYCMDPFYHYHAPWFGLRVTEDTKEYQVPGMLKNFNYDAVLAGSSVVMSINTKNLDEKFDCRTVKAVGGSAQAPLLLYYLNRAFDGRNLRYVFYGLDVFSFYNDPDMQVISDDVSYLVNQNLFDDVEYLWNMDIIGKKIPDMVRMSRDFAYDEGLIYQVNQGAATGPDEVLKMHCPGAGAMLETKPVDFQGEYVTENIKRLKELVLEHQETEFLFFLPPYSIVWWDDAYEKGLLDTYLHTINTCMEQLLACDNVSFYTTDFNEKSIIGDLYQYMDYIHAAPEITNRLHEQIGDNAYEITLEDYQEQTNKLRETFLSFRNKVETEGYGFVFEEKQNY